MSVNVALGIDGIRSQLFQNTYEQSPIGIFHANVDGRVLRSNSTFAHLLGFTLDQIECLSIREFTHPADISHGASEYARLWHGEIDVIDAETRYLRADQGDIWVRVTTALIRDTDGTPTCAVGFVRDISTRKDLSAALLQNQRLLEAVIADIPAAIRACDTAGHVFLYNPAAAEFFAIAKTAAAPDPQEPVPHTVEVFLPDGKTAVPYGERPLACALRGETKTNVELAIARPGSAMRMTLSSARRLFGQNGECLGAVEVTQDVTQQRKLERELGQAHKLESIGQLAAGIAHEINTPTQFIGDNIRFLKESFNEVLDLLSKLQGLVASAPESSAIALAPIATTLDARTVVYWRDEIPKAITQSLEGVERIAKIVGAMKEFSHPGTERTPLDLNRAIASTITVASNEWKYVADIKTDFDVLLPLVPVMPGSFNQVILNIIVNAAHAISAKAAPGTAAKGTITVATRRLNESAEIRISDTGCGMPAGTIPKIFDLFFTTKPVGTGTGQGLAIAHDVVVAKHGGTIDVESELGVGTTFTIRLPLEAAAPQNVEPA
jgi:PAS domain S-box-containing protein